MDIIVNSMGTFWKSMDTISNSTDTFSNSMDTIWNSMDTIANSTDTFSNCMDEIANSMDTFWKICILFVFLMGNIRICLLFPFDD